MDCVPNVMQFGKKSRKSGKIQHLPPSRRLCKLWLSLHRNPGNSEFSIANVQISRTKFHTSLFRNLKCTD